MSKKVTTTERVRHNYVAYLSAAPGGVFHGEAIDEREAMARFDAWLATVRAEALREAAGAWSDWDALEAPEDWLRARADRIEREAGLTSE